MPPNTAFPVKQAATVKVFSLGSSGSLNSFSSSVGMNRTCRLEVLEQEEESGSCRSEQEKGCLILLLLVVSSAFPPRSGACDLVCTSMT